MKIPKTIQFFPGIGGSSNAYLIDEEILIDPGLEEFSGKLASAIKSRGLNTQKIRLIIDTHGHYDHASANSFFKNLTGAKICAHKSDKEKIETGKGSAAEFFSERVALSNVDKVLEAGETIKTKNHTLKVIHTPGHTSGSICLYDEEKKLLISGDTLFADSFGRTDLPTGSREEMTESLKKISNMEVELLLPGHGTTFAGDVGSIAAKLADFV